MNTREKLRSYAPTILRIGMSLVFLWFGTQQLINPEPWTSLIPEFVTTTSGLSASTLVTFNGAFEVVFGIALLLGIFTSLSALLLGLHLISITATVGYNAIGVRDFGLAIATLVIALWGSNAHSISSLFKKN